MLTGSIMRGRNTHRGFPSNQLVSEGSPLINPSRLGHHDQLTNLTYTFNFQKDSFEKIQGFQPPPHDAFSQENVGPPVAVPTRVDNPSIPRNRKNSRTLPRTHTAATNSNGSTSVLKSALPPPPSPGGTRGSEMNSPRASIISTDSGIGTSVGGEIRRHDTMHKGGSISMPNSGSGLFSREGGDSSKGRGGHSADAEFQHRVTVSL